MSDSLVYLNEESEGAGGEAQVPEHQGGEQHHSNQPLVILFIFFGLLIGVILREVNKKTKIPYTPMVVVAGMIMGYYRDSIGVIGDSTTILSGINPHMLLFIFIPVLIFESGFNCDWYVFKRAIVNILILACPGVLIGAILLGFCIRVLLGYGSEPEITWPAAMMMGSILSATDPVAVVALLKELGASVRLNTLIEGESLLNDGTAMVFYQLFLGITKGKSATVSAVLMNFVRSAGGGPLLGFVMGLMGSLWLRRIIRDDVLTSTVTFMTCYITFYFAEFTFFQVSGILAIVVLGLFMSAFGKSNIYPESEHAVHTVWSFAQYGCETLIFLLTGVLIGVNMLGGEPTITQADWVKMFIFWILMVVMRFVMIGMFLPILRKSGYGLTNKEFYVCVWGGLRGALGITLALMVAVDEELPVRLRELTLFYMSGMATLTLLINGTTCKYLVQYLELIEEPAVKQKILTLSIQQLIINAEEKSSQLKSNKYMNLADWDMVQDLSGINELKARAGEESNKLKEGEQGQRLTYEGLKPSDVHEETRFRVLRNLQSLIWERFEYGHMGDEAARILEETCNIALDNVKEPMQLWANCYLNFTQFKTIQYFFRIQDWPLIGKLSKSFITRHLSFIYEVTTNFIICVNEVKEVQLHSPIKNEWLAQVIEELDNDVAKAEEYTSDLLQTFEKMVSAIHTKRASITILEHYKHFIIDYKNKGYIDDADYAQLRKDIDRKMVKLENYVFEETPVQTVDNYFRVQYPIFRHLSNSQINMIKSKSSQKFFPKGTNLYQRDQQITDIYLITKGYTKEDLAGMKVYHDIGNLCNYSNILLEKASFTCTAMSDVQAMAIPLSILSQMKDQCFDFEEQIYKGSGIYFVQNNEEKAKILAKLPEEKINRFFFNSDLVKVEIGQNRKFPQGAYIYYGEFVEHSSEELILHQEPTKIGIYSYIEASDREYTARKTAFVAIPKEAIEIKQTMEEMEIKIEQEMIRNSVRKSKVYIQDQENQYRPPEYTHK